MRFSMCRNDGTLFACESAAGGLLLENCGPSSSADLIIPERTGKLRVFSQEELEVATGRFAKRNYLGKGSHGSLYKGILKDGKVVTVKRQEYVQDELAFNNELEILSTVHAHRFVNLLGFCRSLDAHEKLLVVEYMANGSLHEVLHHSPEPLSWPMRVNIALQVAKALLALHSATPAIIHRDVKSANVMFDSKWNVKLGSFGLAFRGNPEETKSGDRYLQPIGIMGYIEAGNNPTSSRLSTKLDVFSFGILLLELLSGRKPIDVRHKPPSIIDWALPLIKQGKAHCVYDCKLDFQPEYAEALRVVASLAARCVRRTSLKRPSMLYIVAGLVEVSKRIPMPKWTSFANVMKKTTSWQLKHGKDASRSPEFQDMVMRSPRDRTRSLIVPGRAENFKVVDYRSPSPAHAKNILPEKGMSTPRQTCGNINTKQQPHRRGGGSFWIPRDTYNSYNDARLSSIDRVRQWAISIEHPRETARVHAMDRSFPSPREDDAAAAPTDSPNKKQMGSPGQNVRFSYLSHGKLPFTDTELPYGEKPARSNSEHVIDVGTSCVDHHAVDSRSKAKKEADDLEDEDEGIGRRELPPPGTTPEISLDGASKGRHNNNHWRSPVYDVRRSPEKVLSYLTDLSVRTNYHHHHHHHHRASPSPPPGDAAIHPMISSSEARAAQLENLAPHQAAPLRVSTKIKSRSVKTSTRNSHSKTRASFEKEEAYLPW